MSTLAAVLLPEKTTSLLSDRCATSSPVMSGGINVNHRQYHPQEESIHNSALERYERFKISLHWLDGLVCAYQSALYVALSGVKQAPDNRSGLTLKSAHRGMVQP
ncbi:hypothetical protein J6590_007217 [Homalodisca vitripennis]|nr:hypothetical protein J6590_007217 [Homalodisca vitripennis]